MRVPDEDKAPFRPNTSVLNCDDYVIDVMTCCWAEIPESRPNFHMIWNRLKPMRTGMGSEVKAHRTETGKQIEGIGSLDVYVLKALKQAEKREERAWAYKE
ncbi:guanylate cyclase [Elysia marginata]|uniref:Guanylate cyclase n=1 Tax=Elysia marginata TaxID=1093978 RepID=A0AAV4H754_9GAST|nr:guanylate cyclase [Elysia marginata]